jgi:3-hydroxyisobutyrate dehydrogenase-like beta-hydroxyacid dehydrogenase
MNKMKTGVIGTGRIGNPMAKNLLKAGFSVTVYDVRPEAYQDLSELGATIVSSPKEVSEHADVILLSLMHTETIEEVLFGENGICDADMKGKYVIDTSTSQPHKTQEFAQHLMALGAKLIDSPLTGGEAGAQAATLTFFVGGEEKAFEAVKPVLEALASQIYFLGDSGSGHIVKLAHQMMMACYFVSIAEAFAYIEKMGVDGCRFFEAVEHGGPESKILSGFGKSYARTMSGETLPDDPHYTPTFAKDLSYALQESFRQQVYMPAAATAEEVFKQALRMKVKGGSPILKLLEFWRILNHQ